VKLDIGNSYENLSTNSKFCANQAQILGTLHETLSTFYCCQLYYIIIKVLSSSKTVSGCWDSWGSIHLTGICHNVMLCVHCLPC